MAVAEIEDDADELTSFVLKMDKNNSSFIDFNEFIVAFMDRSLLVTKKSMTSIFNDIDKKKKKAISKEDLKLALPALASDNEMTLNLMMQQFNLDIERRITL